MYDVCALGELLIDFLSISDDISNYPVMRAQPGGAPANFLGAAARCGCSTALLGKVGDDAFGHMLISTVSQNGIDIRGLVSDPAFFTTLAFVTLSSNGNREFSFARKPGADTQLSIEEVDTDIIRNSKVFHFGTLSLSTEPAKSTTQYCVAFAQRCGKLISFDPNLRLPLWSSLEDARQQMLWGLGMADIIKISDEETEFLFGKGIKPEESANRILGEFGAKLVYITLGAKGCYYSNGNISATLPALSGIDVIDTTGAGDIFGGSAMAMFLSIGKSPEYLSRDDLFQIVSYAVCAAGISTSSNGGIASIPNPELVLERCLTYRSNTF